MEAFRVQLLVTFMLLIQTAGASDPTEVSGIVGESVTFPSPGTDGDVVLWSFGNDPIMAVISGDPPVVMFYQEKFQTRFAVTEGGRALRISQLSLDDAGIYCVSINGEKSIFILHVHRAHSGILAWIGAVAMFGIMVLSLILVIFYCKSRVCRKFHLSRPNPTDTVATAESRTVCAEVAASQN